MDNEEKDAKKIWGNFLLQVLSALIAALTAYFSVFVLLAAIL